MLFQKLARPHPCAYRLFSSFCSATQHTNGESLGKLSCCVVLTSFLEVKVQGVKLLESRGSLERWMGRGEGLSPTARFTC